MDPNIFPTPHWTSLPLETGPPPFYITPWLLTEVINFRLNLLYLKSVSYFLPPFTPYHTFRTELNASLKYWYWFYRPFIVNRDLTRFRLVTSNVYDSLDIDLRQPDSLVSRNRNHGRFGSTLTVSSQGLELTHIMYENTWYYDNTR